MDADERTRQDLLDEIEELRRRLEDSESALEAIRQGEVDAVVACGPEGERVFILREADRSYRVLMEEMAQGALTLMPDGAVLYANRALADMLGRPLERLAGPLIHALVAPEDQELLASLLERGAMGNAQAELSLLGAGDRRVPALVSAGPLRSEGEPTLWATVTDLTQQKRHEEIVASERLSRSILEQAGELVVVCDPAGRVLRASRNVHGLLGRSPLGEPFADLFPLRAVHGPAGSGPPGEAVPQAFSLAPVLAGTPVHALEAWLGVPGAQDRFVTLSASPLHGTGERLLGCVIVMADISERKRGELALRASEERLSVTLGSIGDGIISTDGSGRIDFMNPVAEELTGWKNAEARGRDFHQVFHLVEEHTGRELESPVARVLREGTTLKLAPRTMLRRKDGTELPVDDSTAPIWNGTRTRVDERVIPVKDERGQVRGVVIVFRDVTQRRHAEASLRESEERFRDLYENAPAAYFSVNPDGRVERCNRRAGELLGYRTEDLVGRPVLDLCAETEHGKRKAAAVLQRFAAGGEVQDEELVMRKGDGSPLWISLTLNAVRDAGGRVQGSRWMAVDISERMRMEKDLGLSARELRVRNRVAQIWLTSSGEDVYPEMLCAVLEALESPDGLFGYMDQAGAMVCFALSRGAQGRCVAPGEPFALPPERWEGFWGRGLGEKRAFLPDAPLPAPGGPVPVKRSLAVPILYRGRTIGLVQAANKQRDYASDDVRILEAVANQVGPVLHERLERERRESEKELLERQLRQTQKLEAIGNLAGGIAHDFNNILAFITGYSELLLMSAGEGTEERSILQNVLKASLRGAELVRQILTFCRQEKAEMKPVDVGLVAREALKFLRSTVPTTIEIRQNIDRRARKILADPTQIHQLFINLFTNAAHAMRESGGDLEVDLSETEMSRADLTGWPGLAPGPYLRIAVRDTGVGMPAHVMEHIFEPFFTTRPRGEGTGLGLSVVHGIVKSHEGDIRVHSQPGQGTRFELLLPVDPGGLGEQASPDRPAPVPGRERVLFVDDEAQIAALNTLALERLGYEVVARTSSVEALELFRAGPDRFDVVVSDMTMPDMTGTVLAAKLLDIRPDLPVILCTGYSDRITPETTLETGVREVLMKPLSIGELTAAIRRAVTPGGQA